MKSIIYFAVFSPCSDGVDVRFPDAEGACTCGDSINEAIDMAVDVLSATLACCREGVEYVEPSSYEEILELATPGDLVFPIIPNKEITEEYKLNKEENNND